MIEQNFFNYKRMEKEKKYSLHTADFLALWLMVLYFMFSSIQVMDTKLEAEGKV